MAELSRAARRAARALELQSNDARALAARGAAKVPLGLPREAMADLNRALELQPNDARVFVVIGVAKVGVGLVRDAIEDV